MKQSNFSFIINLSITIKSSSSIIKKITGNSADSPDWFKINSQESKRKQNELLIENNQSLHVLSKFRNWITITPKSKNRRKPLENEKSVKYFIKPTYIHNLQLNLN
jgi:hypothetical protein